MRFFEIFDGYTETMGSALDAITKRADQSIKAGAVLKKQASVSKAKEKLNKAQKALTNAQIGGAK